MRAALSLAIALAALGCGDGAKNGPGGSVLGAWTSAPVVDQRSDLMVEDGGDAEATLYIVQMQGTETSAGRFEFEATWESDDGDIVFAMSCLETPFGACEDGDDFMMRCDYESESLGCDGDQNWSEYDFAWTRP